MRYAAALALAALAVFAGIAFAFGWDYAWLLVVIILAMIFGLPMIELTLEYWFGPMPPAVVVDREERRRPF